MTHTLETVYEKNPQCAWNSLEGDMVIVRADTGEVITLNSTGGAIWELCDGLASLSEVVSKLCDEYEGDLTEIQKAALKFVTLMTERGLLKVKG